MRESALRAAPLNPKQVLNCPMCEASAYREIGRPLLPVGQDFPCGFVPMSGSWIEARSLRQCSSCGLRYYGIIPHTDNLVEQYQSDVVAKYWTDSGPRGLASKVQRSIPAVWSSDSVQALDIGCHTGEFLQSLPSRWARVGIDPSSEAIARARASLPEAEFRAARLEDADLPSAAFDVVTAWDVFEHQELVSEFVGKIAWTLRRGGHLILETGNYASRYARLAGLTWYYYSPLDHTIFFTPIVIRFCLEWAGLRVVHLERTAHARRSTKARIASSLSILAINLYTVRGRSRTVHWKLAGLLGKNGALPDPGYRDHMLVVAQRPM